MPNAELAWRIYDLTQKYPHHLNMARWSCVPIQGREGAGTTACMADWVAAEAGYQVDFMGFVRTLDGRLVHTGVEIWAAQRLGITNKQQAMLFWCESAELGEVIEEIFGPRPEATGPPC